MAGVTRADPPRPSALVADRKTQDEIEGGREIGFFVSEVGVDGVPHQRRQ